jgi:hypothetical protein
MIDLQKYERILEEGLILDHYFLLLSLRDGNPTPNSKRVRGFVNLLTKKGYILEGILTEKGVDLMGNDTMSVPEFPTTTAAPIDFGEWVISLHRKCQEKIKQFTGYKHVRDKIVDKKTGKASSYSFLPNPGDMGNRLITVIKKYKLKDMDMIERAILGHVERCGVNKKWFPLVKYYIHKDGESDMVTDMQNPSEEIRTIVSPQKHV